ncbi:head completion/stabilization protein [Halomonas colorata]|uniref:head completion/stabilization protein n=1 Tax=Halomonas colorata TaxID=2742615 RepID=UPI001866358B|nr:head completion/stabilization protein [Halomonas colorata]
MLGHSSNPPSKTLAIIINNGFWPDVDPNAFRDEERVTSITDVRIRQSLRAAMADINRQLASYQHNQQQAGRMACDAIPPEPWQSPGDIELLYTRAIYAQAQADLQERYRDYSATGEGKKRGETMDTAADDYRADAREAIAELTGRNHTTVELI